MKELMKKMLGEEDNGDMKDQAKMKVLKHLKELASGMMGDDLGSLKKVTVAAPDAAGLKKGLDTAKDAVGKMRDFDHDQGKELMEEECLPDETYEEDMTEDELDAEIAHLMELKQKLMENQ